MYIEFELPQSGPIKFHHASFVISMEVAAWAEQHQISYKIKSVKYTQRVILTKPEDYTMFGLTWDPTVNYRWVTGYRFVEPMKVDKRR
jgi:hypothetical protein